MSTNSRSRIRFTSFAGKGQERDDVDVDARRLPAVNVTVVPVGVVAGVTPAAGNTGIVITADSEGIIPRPVQDHSSQ